MRAHLVDVALRLFSAHGYTSTSTRRIADESGVAESLVFHYFPSKEALLAAVFASEETLTGRVLRAVDSSKKRSIRSLLRTVAAGFSAMSSKERAFVALMLREADGDRALRAHVAARHVEMVARIEKQLARDSRGELRPGASLRTLLLGFAGGLAFFFQQHRDLDERAWRAEASRFARAWADQCWRGVAREPAKAPREG